MECERCSHTSIRADSWTQAESPRARPTPHGQRAPLFGIHERRGIRMTKLLDDRQNATEALASAADAHAKRIARAFVDLFSPYLEGEEKIPDVGLVLKLFAR